MPAGRFEYQPPLPLKPAAEPFVQLVRLLDEAGRPIGTARWHVRADVSDGVVQLLDLTIAPTRGREGRGSALLNEVVAQARQYLKSRRVNIRRLWMVVEQKSQVVGRAFLTGRGFHHVATINNIMKDQDALVYVRTFD